MAMTLGEIIVNVKSDTSHLVKGFNAAETRVNKAAKTMNNSIKILTAGFIGLSAVDLVGTLSKQADEMTNINSKLKLVTKSTEDLVNAQTELFQISQDTRTSYSANIDLFQRMTNATKDLNRSQEDTISLNETISKSLIISGTSAEGVTTLITQLGQAFSSNFQAVAQELGTIRDQAPRLYEAMLTGSGLTRAEFKKAAEEGTLSSKIIIDAIESQASSINKEFGTITKTISGAKTQLNNSTIAMIGQFDKLSGASAFVAENISLISNSIDGITPENIEDTSKAIKIAAVTIGTMVIGVKAYSKATVTATAANALYGGSFGAVNRAIVLTTISSKALSLAMKAIPFVAIAGTIALVSNSLFEASKASDELDDSLSKTGKTLSELTKNQLEYRKIVLDNALQDALMERQKAVIDAAHQGFLESDEDHALDLKNKDESIAKFREIRSAALEVEKALKTLNTPIIEVSKSPTSKQSITSSNTDQTLALDKLSFELYQEYIDKKLDGNQTLDAQVTSYYQHQADLQAQATAMLTTDQEKAIENFLAMEQAILSLTGADAWSTSDMDKFYKKAGDNIASLGDSQKTIDEDKNSTIATQASATAGLATAIANASSEESDLKKAMELTAIVAGSIAILNQAKGDPYTAFARMAAMAVQVASVLGAFGGGSSSSVSSSTASQSELDEEYETASNDLILGKFDRQIELLESIDSSGTAAAFSVEAAIAQVEADIGSLSYDISGSLSGLLDSRSFSDVQNLADSSNVLEFLSDEAKAWISGYENFASQINNAIGVDILSVSTTAGVSTVGSDVSDTVVNSTSAISIDTSGLVNNIDATISFLEYFSNNLDVADTLLSVKSTGIIEWLDEIQEYITDYASTMVDVVDTMSDASSDFKEFYDGITGTTFYEDIALAEAYKDFNELKGNSSYADYLKEQITAISAVEEAFDTSITELLLSTDADLVSEQLAAVGALTQATNFAFEGGVEEALNYLESINLVSESLSNSRENITSWLDSFKSEDELLNDLSIGNGQIARTSDELNSLFKTLSGGIGGLTDSELEFLEANKDFLDGISDSLESTFDSLGDTIDNLRDSASSSTSDLDKFYASMSQTQMLSGDLTSDEFTSSLSDTQSYASALYDSDNFDMIRDMEFAQAVAANQFEKIQGQVETEMDLLKSQNEQLMTINTNLNKLIVNSDDSLDVQNATLSIAQSEGVA